MTGCPSGHRGGSRGATAEVAGWIWQHNLRSLLELLSHYVGYDFDGTDWETVAPAPEETDRARGRAP